ncbi:MAG: TonB-dependent receptor [Bacteroidota bacterium]
MHAPALLLLAGGLLTGTGDSSPGRASADTLSPKYSLDEIVVTATRGNALAAVLPSPVTLINGATIEAGPGSLLADALSGIPSLSLRSYGGPASVRTIGLRGMGPEHTLVLVDGQRVNSVQNSQVDFGLLSSSDIERVEVVRGGYSALYGADAVGGVINVISRGVPEQLTAAVVTSAGSNGFSAMEASAGGKTGFAGLRVMIRRERGRGDYLFKFDDGRVTTELRRQGEDFSVLTGNAHLELEFGDGVRSAWDLSYIDADRGTPGTVTGVSSNGLARLTDRVASLRTRNSWDASPALNLQLAGTLQYAREGFIDPHVLLNGSALNSDYANHALIVTPSARMLFSPLTEATAGVEFGQASLQSNDVNDARRIQRSAFITARQTVELPWETPYDLILYPSIRYDSFSDVSGDVSPRLGLSVGLLKEPSLRLRTSYGKSFRAPGFNDLYWIAGGNPRLSPERAISFDAGARAEFSLAGMVRLEASYFSIDTRDRIVWVPGAAGLWAPRNISSVTSRGVEAEAAWTGFDGTLTLTANSTWTETKKTSEDYPGDPTRGKYLVYVPRQNVALSASAKVGDATLCIRHTWSSYRYATEINDRFLPSYSLTSAAVRYAFPLGPLTAAVKGEVENLFNVSYQIIASYPMPLRQFRGSVEVAL